MGLSRRVLADGEEVVYEARPHWLALVAPSTAVVAVVATLAGVAITVPEAPVAVAWGLGALGLVAALWLGVRALRWRRTVVAVTNLRVLERSGVLSRRGDEIRLDRIAELSYRQSLVGMLVGAGQVIVETGSGGAVALDDVRRPARLQSIITDQVTAYQRTMAASVSRWGMAPSPRDDPPTWPDPVRPPGDPGDRGAPSWAVAPPRSGGPGGSETPPAGTAAVGWPGRSAPAGPGAGTVAERLTVLRDLHLRGLVSDQEFASKRAELLDQL